ncbi:MAG: hypothetical protein FWB79_01685 [Treponema sp.]|nr:hypothetical protein [Treponema sp.]
MRTGMGPVAVLASLALIFAQGCSTRPGGRGDVYDTRIRAETQLELGNRQADRGDLDAALALLDEAMRFAVLADDSGLRVRAGLSRGNVLLSLGRADEARAGMNLAVEEALRTGDRELAALARIHEARRRLLSPGGAGAAGGVVEEVSREMALLRDPVQVAFAWTVVALAEGELGRYDRAEAAARRSLAAHERGRRLELAAFDWFMIASFRSRSGDFAGARLALEASMSLDRRVENSWGLASGWRALGDVERRAGNPDAARAAYARASEIFRALGNYRAADEALSRVE